MISAGPTGMVFFDVDGTLVPATSSSAFLAGFLGHRDVLVEAEAAYVSGDMSNQQVSAIDAAGWAGRSPQEIEAWLDDLPLIDGISETLAWCQANQLAPVLATLAWSPVGHYLARRFGFLSFSGPELEVLDGKFTGYVARDFDEFDKRDTALAQARQLGLTPAQCAAIGDSRSDLPLFTSTRTSIAFNATQAAKAAATSTVTGDDLQLVLPALRNFRDLIHRR
jgi:phosphoserine phosphatase